MKTLTTTLLGVAVVFLATAAAAHEFSVPATVTADGFCMILMEPGTYTYPVSGSLIYLFMPGSVIYRHSMCDGWVGTGTTIILPPTVADTPVTWSGLKALYR